MDQVYGPHARHRYDFFGVQGVGGRPIAVFIHGGYWQRMDRTFYSQLAAGPNAHGLDAVIAQYRLCPEVRVADIFEDMRQLIRHLAQRAGRPLILAGHSAGGQLACLLSAHNWAMEGLAKSPILAALSISGVYDLAPLVRTSLNEALRLDDAEARAASPQFGTSVPQTPVLCVVGELETEAFQRQQAIFVDRCAGLGAAVQGATLSGHHHFSIIEDLANPKSAMTQWIAGQAR